MVFPRHGYRIERSIMTLENNYSKLSQPPVFKLDDIVMDMVGNKLRYSHRQTNGIIICAYLDGTNKSRAWYGIPSQLVYWNDQISKRLQQLSKDIEIAEQNTQSLYSARNKLWQSARPK